MAKETEEKQLSAVERTMNILEAISKSGEANLETLSKQTSLPKATLLRFLSSLSSLGYIFRDDADRYHLTMKMFSIGSRSLKNLDLIKVAEPFAAELSKELGETVHMGILEEDQAIYVLKEESYYTIRMYSRVGKAIPLYCTAIGKIFLSEMSEKELSDYFKSHKLKPFTPKSIRTETALREELKRIKERGWSIDDEEHEENIMCIAAPIRDYRGNVLSAISVSWPLFRFDRNNFEHELKRIKEAAAEISRIYGSESQIS